MGRFDAARPVERVQFYIYLRAGSRVPAPPAMAQSGGGGAAASSERQQRARCIGANPSLTKPTQMSCGAASTTSVPHRPSSQLGSSGARFPRSSGPTSSRTPCLPAPPSTRPSSAAPTTTARRSCAAVSNTSSPAAGGSSRQRWRPRRRPSGGSVALGTAAAGHRCRSRSCLRPAVSPRATDDARGRSL